MTWLNLFESTILTACREAGAIILKIAYGYTIEPHKKDFLVHISKLAVDQFSIAGTPGVWLVDIIPACVYPAPLARNNQYTNGPSEIHPPLAPWG